MKLLPCTLAVVFFWESACLYAEVPTSQLIRTNGPSITAIDTIPSETSQILTNALSTVYFDYIEDSYYGAQVATDGGFGNRHVLLKEVGFLVRFSVDPTSIRTLESLLSEAVFELSLLESIPFDFFWDLQGFDQLYERADNSLKLTRVPKLGTNVYLVSIISPPAVVLTSNRLFRLTLFDREGLRMEQIMVRKTNGVQLTYEINYSSDETVTSEGVAAFYLKGVEVVEAWLAIERVPNQDEVYVSVPRGYDLIVKNTPDSKLNTVRSLAYRFSGGSTFEFYSRSSPFAPRRRYYQLTW